MSFNLGLSFVTLFRWLLLLLFSLLIEKSAEGITYLVNNQVIYTSHVVHAPLFGLSDDLMMPTLMPHWPYVVGILQMVITLLFAARYFLCLVDPLERIIGIHRDQVDVTDSGKIVDSLQQIRIGHILLVVFIAIPEFLFLFHAATSFGSYHQWICFLLLLVLWDSILFVGVIGYLHHVVTMFIKVQTKYFKITQWVGRRRHGIKVYQRFIKNSDTGDLIDQYVKASAKRNTEVMNRLKHYEDIKDQLKSARTDYGPWNFLDGIVLLTGLIDRSLYLNPGVTSLITNSSWIHLIINISIVILLIFFSWKLTRKFVRENKERARLKIGFVTAGIVLLFGSLLIYYDSKFSWSKSVGASEFVLLSLVCIGITFFSYLNYKAQPELWHRHLTMLKLR